MIIDYSVPDFSFQVGGFDATQYLSEWEIHLPISEITQPLTWRGRFKLSYNRQAYIDGLAADYFDEFANPSLWRPAQVPVVIEVSGQTLPVLRIERYAYDPQTKTGEGTLYQILDAIDHDRPSTDAGIEVATTPISIVIFKLMQAAFLRSRFTPTMSLGVQDGELLGGITTRSPVRDAQAILGAQWQWLTVNNAEQVRVISGAPVAAILTRTADQVEIKRETDQIAFPSRKVIVTGSRQVPAGSVTGSARPKFQTAEEYLPFNQVFENGGGTSTTQTLAETKRIAYLYPDDRVLDFTVAADIPTSLLNTINTTQPISGADPNVAYLTVTVKRWPAGRIFKSLGTNTSMNTAEIIVQSEDYRDIWVPFGTLDVSGASTSFTMVRLRKETLTTTPVGLNIVQAGGVLLEPGQLPERQQPRAEIPTTTQAMAGEAVVSPAGWSPLIERNSVIEVGFLPNQAIADQLAKRMAAREQYRRNTIIGKMPIPSEWLAAGCPVLPVFTLGDGDYLCEGLALVFQHDEAYLGMTGNRLTYNGVSTIAEVVEVTIAPRMEIDITVYTGSARLFTLDSTAYTDV